MRIGPVRIRRRSDRKTWSWNALVLPRQASVLDAMRHGDEEALVAVLDGLKDGNQPLDVLKDVAAILRSTRSRRVRNTAAMALADSGLAEMSAPIVAALRDERVAGEAGTLLFALGELGGTLPLDVAARLIAKGSFEARAETLTFFELGRVEQGDGETCRAAKDALAALSMDKSAEVAESAKLALALLGATA